MDLFLLNNLTSDMWKIPLLKLAFMFPFSNLNCFWNSLNEKAPFDTNKFEDILLWLTSSSLSLNSRFSKLVPETVPTIFLKTLLLSSNLLVLNFIFTNNFF